MRDVFTALQLPFTLNEVTVRARNRSNTGDESLSTFGGRLGLGEDVEGAVLDEVVRSATFARLGRVVLHLEVGLDEDLGAVGPAREERSDEQKQRRRPIANAFTHPFASFMMRSTAPSPKAKMLWKLLV